MAYILDFLREKMGTEPEDDEEIEGFPDMNYKVGNTTGMDVGQEPGPLPERIGSTAQKGGEVLEVLLQNPATFQVDRRELLNVIEQLGVDITLHGNTDLGFAAAYATRAQGVPSGFNIVHRYFKRYLEQMASFKTEVEQGTDQDFKVGYVNMHASTEQLPPLEEQIASDKSLDPFGKPIGEVDPNEAPNIYMNQDFMELLFDYLVLEYTQPLQIFDNFFVRYSNRFEKEWLKAQEKQADDKYMSRTGKGGVKKQAMDKAALVETASNVDQGMNIEFREKIDRDLPSTLTLPAPQGDPREEITIETLEDALTPGRQRVNIRNISERVYDLNNDLSGDDLEMVLEELINVFDEIWLGNGTGNSLSFRGKAQALSNRLDVDSRKLMEDAANSKKIENKAKKVFAGDPEYIDREDKQHLELFDRLINQSRLAQEIDKESTVFYNIMPAWLLTADKEHEDHEGWEAPRFIWKTIVENEYDDVDFDDYSSVNARLESDREFRLDVTAAVGATYMWGQFTQVKDDYEGIEELDIDEEQGCTWIKWMNKHGLTVNIEAMHGDPGNLLRLWRPKDIAVGCRAINMTAKKKSDNWEEEYTGPMVKFTIDLEHTASYGVDPEKELEVLIEQEKELAEQDKIDTDPEKPLADILKTYHLTKPGFEQQGIHRHGPFRRGDTVLYRYLYKMIEAGFCRGDDEGIVMFEIGGEYMEELFVTRIAMDMIEAGITPEDNDPADLPMDGEFDNEKQALIARFFGLDKASTSREWTKIEEHAFDPLEGLLESAEFGYTFSSMGAIKRDKLRQWPDEEYK